MQVIFDPSIAISWLLFLALFPMAFIWLRRAFRIFVGGDHTEVALKRGLSPANPKKYAIPAGLINLTAGGVATWVIVGVPLYVATGIQIGPFPSYDTWSAISGVTIWSKLIADFLLSRHAHPYRFGKKKGAPAK
jgi:hypothetical protein